MTVNLFDSSVRSKSSIISSAVASLSWLFSISLIIILCYFKTQIRACNSAVLTYTKYESDEASHCKNNRELAL